MANGSFIAISVRDRFGKADGFSTNELTKKDIARAHEFLDTFQTDDAEDETRNPDGSIKETTDEQP